MSAEWVDRLTYVWAGRIVEELRDAGVETVWVGRRGLCQFAIIHLKLLRASDLAKVQDPKMVRRLAHAIKRDDCVQVTSRDGLVLIEVELPDQCRVPLPLASLRPGRALRVPVGNDLDDRAVFVNLASPDTPHALVAGTTGSGKSVLLQVLTIGLMRQNAPHELGLILIDGKGDAGKGLMPLAGASHLSHPVITDAQQGAAVLTWLVSELERRAAGWSQRLVCIVDEVQAILDETGGARGQAAQAIVRLTTMGRSRGISLVLATQHPVAEVLGGSLAKANLPLRLIGKVTDSRASSNATGQAGAAAHRLRGRGDWLKVMGDDVRRFQVALPSDEDLARLPRGGAVPELTELIRTMDQDIAASVLKPGQVVHRSQTPRAARDEDVAWAVSQAHERSGVVPGLLAIRTHCSSSDGYARRVQAAAQEALSQVSHPSQVSRAPCEDDRPVLRVLKGVG